MSAVEVRLLCPDIQNSQLVLIMYSKDTFHEEGIHSLMSNKVCELMRIRVLWNFLLMCFCCFFFCFFFVLDWFLLLQTIIERKYSRRLLKDRTKSWPLWKYYGTIGGWLYRYTFAMVFDGFCLGQPVSHVQIPLYDLAWSGYPCIYQIRVTSLPKVWSV